MNKKKIISWKEARKIAFEISDKLAKDLQETRRKDAEELFIPPT